MNSVKKTQFREFILQTELVAAKGYAVFICAFIRGQFPLSSFLPRPDPWQVQLIASIWVRSLVTAPTVELHFR